MKCERQVMHKLNEFCPVGDAPIFEKGDCGRGNARPIMVRDIATDDFVRNENWCEKCIEIIGIIHSDFKQMEELCKKGFSESLASNIVLSQRHYAKE